MQAVDNNEVPKRRKVPANWIMLFILSLLLGGVLYNVWNLLKTLETPLLGP